MSCSLSTCPALSTVKCLSDALWILVTVDIGKLTGMLKQSTTPCSPPVSIPECPRVSCLALSLPASPQKGAVPLAEGAAYPQALWNQKNKVDTNTCHWKLQILVAKPPEKHTWITKNEMGGLIKMDVRRFWGWKMNGTTWGSCPISGFSYSVLLNPRVLLPKCH